MSDINTVSQQSVQEWYLAASKPRQETRAIENLHNQGITAFAPTIFVEKLYAGKKRVIEEALFPGYVFISLSPKDGLWHKVRSTRGIRDWVRFSSIPAKLPLNLVQEFIEKQNNDQQEVVKRCFNPGDCISIMSGPFRGLKGIYEASSGEERSLILIEFLGKVNRLKLENNQFIVE
ncbi:transcription/translation regulatory transformer protein RfaH [Aliikangiella maris]|uniref:Transcription/translation regulatory transformer protein RfaH n=2 Tax=Aliikangiella maris TaxID=3162458 RepID=A0ABV3MHX4_9GAMM